MKKNLNEYDWNEHVDVESINMQNGTVKLSNGYMFDHKTWFEHFVNFWDKRVVGKTIVPTFYEYLFASGGSHQYSQLVTGKEHEGFLTGQMGKPLDKKKAAIAVGAILALAIGGVIVLVIAKNQGLLPFLGG